ncbi:hypothetical protein JR065_05855 [Xanthomonas sp. AmX2]|uniref:hypothetical protein n=1 Tax=Xanthomonas sp. TaxID=29446 RepID=UPI00197DF3F3|nr:hypothetical protein [Xanthomonas sp.]MBN6149856.1 hypothetical protein [Xanthomonas sp.]
MRFKLYLSSAAIAVSLLGPLRDASAGNDKAAWPGSIAGKCYPSLNDYVLSAFPWTKDGEDENIRRITASETADGGEAYVWVIDATPNTNVVRTLFRVGAEQACVVLDAAPSSTMELEISDNVLPSQATSLDTPPPGIPMTRVIYKLDRDGSAYHPYQCERVESAAGIGKKIDCAKIFGSR